VFPTLVEALRKRCAQAAIADQQVTRRSRKIADFENRCSRAKKAAHMEDRPQLRARHSAEWDDRGRVAVHHRHHIRPPAVNFAVNESLQIHRRPARRDGSPVEIELQHVLFGDKRGRHASGQQKAIRPIRMTDADMAESVDDAIAGKNAIGDDQVIDERCLCTRR